MADPLALARVPNLKPATLKVALSTAPGARGVLGALAASLAVPVLELPRELSRLL